jgi:hypothetical protein
MSERMMPNLGIVSATNTARAIAVVRNAIRLIPNAGRKKKKTFTELQDKICALKWIKLMVIVGVNPLIKWT